MTCCNITLIVMNVSDDSLTESIVVLINLNVNIGVWIGVNLKNTENDQCNELYMGYVC